MANKVNKTVTAMFIERVAARRAAGETVVAPWRKPWNPAHGADRNIVSDKPYRGSNIWMTAVQGFSSPFWGTYKQWEGVGGTLKRDENEKCGPYTPIAFWLFPKPGELNKYGQPKGIIHLFSPVYNSEQVNGIDELIASKSKASEGPTIDPIEAAQAIVAGWTSGPSIGHGGGRACYAPSHDRVEMPAMQAFESAGAYYHTLYHELTHSTGHRKRLNRDGITNIASFKSHSYSHEELIAEMGAGMLANHAGISCESDEANSAAYLDGWLKRLAKEPEWLASAGGKAQKALDHILGIKWN